jgi:hypothetical protein
VANGAAINKPGFGRMWNETVGSQVIHYLDVCLGRQESDQKPCVG